MKRLTLIFFPYLMYSGMLTAAETRTITTQPLIWTRVTNTLVIDSHWYLYAEADNRIFLSPVKESQALFRIVGRYVVNRGIETGIGFVSSLNFPGDPHASGLLLTPEYRASWDVTFKQTYGSRITLNHRNVIENRFIHNSSSTELEDGYKYIFRYRYRLQADFLLWRKKNTTLKFILSNEIMLQAGKEILYNVFEMNRAYGAINYEPMKWLAFEAGYMNFFQQRKSGEEFYNRHILRLTIYTKIFLHPKK